MEQIIQADEFIVDVKEYDWILGNHCDELTPWIPIIASRSSPQMKYVYTMVMLYFDATFTHDFGCFGVLS
jgi:tRNASer (uridine44-2'-O)-methyltransferase